MKALYDVDSLPLADTVLCDDHDAFQYASLNTAVEYHSADWDHDEEFTRVDAELAQRAGLRCQICGSQD